MVTAMADAIRHRGPDDSGVWTSPEAGVALSHRRLSIVDLSPTGHQPMTSPAGRYVISYNGEIYNFQQLRAELEDGVRFRGTSDTEVLLAGCDRWGVEETLRRATGMFAFALWDTQEHTLFLARDRMGEKPLYVAQLPWGIAFASELRSFERLPGWDYDIDVRGLASLVSSGYIAEHLCIDRKVSRVPPASLVVIPSASGPEAASVALANPRRYWSFEEAVAATEVPDNEPDAVTHLEDLLRSSLQGQRMADVPVGAFLSGGVDSSVITSVLQSISPDPVRTFSIGFDDSDYDEARFAAAVAQHLKCSHTEFRVSPAEALRVVGGLADVYDEPLADPSQVPTILVSRLARQAVIVCLSGDGGDELFGGYNRYFWSGRWGRKFQSLPGPVRRTIHGAASGALQIVPDAAVRRLVRAQVGGGGGPLQDPRGKLRKALEMLRIDDPVVRYSRLTRVADPELLLTTARSDGSDPGLRRHTSTYGEVFGAMMYDIGGYLPGDQLARVDRASMAVSLEMRAPLLDHRVATFGFAASRAFGETRLAAEPKWLLKHVLYRHVPRHLVDRPKMGFSIPLDRWLRIELRDWAEGLLTASALDDGGFFQTGAVRRLWSDHLGGKDDHSRALWSVLMFQQWRNAVRARRPQAPATVA